MGEALAPRPRTALRIGLRHDTRLEEARVVSKPDLNDCKLDECYEPPQSQLRESTQVDLYAVEGADVSTGVGAHEPKLQAA